MKKRFVSALLALCLLLSAVPFGAFAQPAEEEEQPIAVDLTKMSDMMIYALMYDILKKPQDYADQRMRLVGVYSPFKNPDTGEMEHTLIFYDVSFCCEVELRVYVKDEYTYPRDFPMNGEKMTVLGKFHVEEKDQKIVCWLEDGVLE